MWPSTDEALTRRRDASVAASAVFRTVMDREPTPDERVEMLRRVQQGLTVSDLVQVLSSTPEGAERITTLASRIVRDQLDAGFGPAGTEDGPTPARVVFLHIMKTGGTSLSDVLRRWTGGGAGAARIAVPLDDMVLLPRPQLARLRALAGHIPFEALEMIPGPFISVSVLRDPVARTLSHYRELRRSEEPLRDLSLDEFLSNEVYDVPSGNYQARSLAHTIDVAGAWVDYSPRERYGQAGGDPAQPYPLQALFDSTPIRLGEDELLERASHNLARLDHVGVTEHMEAMVARLARVLGRPDLDVPRLNISSPAEAIDLPVALRRRIERRTEVDRELYQKALELSQG